MNTNTIKISYKSSVLVAAGWRSISITALAELNKYGKKGTVTEVLDVDGEGVVGYASRTGANRQKYNVGYIVRREIGATKIISKVEVIN
ncbi:MAG: hypothetical protein WC449_05680 [Candidatus Paceibacterota bacterium]